MSLPFLRTESEETATQAAAFVAVVIITLGLATMNVMGVLAGSQGSSIGQWVIRISLAVIVSGAELLGAVILVRVMLAPNRLRKVVGSLIFLGVAWACIQNGKRAVHLIYPEFAESSALLEAKAGIAGEEAGLIKEARGKAIDATPQELARVRTDIAALKAEQQLMASQSPEKIREAQSLLIAQGKYRGQVDGIRERLTESAMRSRGEEIARELTTLGLREEALAAGAVTAAAGVAAGESPAVLQADLADKARKAKAATIWLEVMLWVFEAARSFGLWALVTTITAQRKAGVTIPDDEYEYWKAAKEEKDVRMSGAKRGVETKAEKKERETREVRQQGKIEASMKEMRKKVSAFLVDRAKGMSIAEIAEKHNTSVAAMAMQYRNYMDDTQYDLLFGSGYRPMSDGPRFDAPMPELQPLTDSEAEAEAEPDPETAPEETATAEPDPDLEIPDEPKDYDVVPYAPPANDEPQDKDAA
jgi:hypothetical protein